MATSETSTDDALARRPMRIFVSVAEQSADEHAAMLVRAALAERPNLTFAGLAGPALVAEGVESYEDLTRQSAMALAAFKKVPWALKLLKRVRGYLERGAFDAVVLTDSPALHLPMAKLCRKLGIPVLFYIAPQTWAWGPPNWRNKRIRQRVDRLACIWPFEEPYFRKAGINATYVGHPSFDRFAAVQVDESAVAAMRAGADKLVTILPGSRPHVIDEVLPGQLEVAAAIRNKFTEARFVIVAANDEADARIARMVGERARPLRIERLKGDQNRAAAIGAADLVLAASGTVTLEVAYRAAPMIVMYNSGRWTYELVARWLIRTTWLSIPNIIAQREMVPEFMPYYTSTQPIADRAIELLSDDAARQRMRDDLTRTIQPLVKTGAAENAVKLLFALLDNANPA